MLSPTRDVAKVWLLEPDGTPTGEFRWDRKLRADGEQHAGARSMAVGFADGEAGLWRWIVTHLHSGYERVRFGSRGWPTVYPIAAEMWGQREEGDWLHWVLPRLNPVDPLAKVPDDGAWPLVRWHAVENPRWPCDLFGGGPHAWWFTVEPERPADAPEPLEEATL